MTALKCSKGNTIYSPKDIQKETVKFYSELYTSDPKVKFTLTNKSNTSLDEATRDSLESPITMEELTKSVHNLKKNKVAGSDGWNAEFYQFFWQKIKDLYLEVIQTAFENCRLHLTAHRGIIQLIPKKDRDPLLLKNWHPLTMLNTDYKRLAITLANRLKPLLLILISENQTGFVQGCQISSTIRTTLDITGYSKKIQGYILSLDFVKCFDRIEYSVILGSMEYFNIGMNFRTWTSLLLNQFESCTMNNGYASQYLTVSRSCHQGFPLAPTLFLLCGEVMAQKIKEHEGINGIKINDLEHIIEQFADNTQLFLATQQAMCNIIAVLSLIETNTGLRVNYEKSSIHCIGNAEPFDCTENLIWDPGGLPMLGIDAKVPAHNQYCSTLQKATNVLNHWYYHELTLLGKVMVINTLVAPLFVYSMQVLKNPTDSFFHMLNQLIEQFLWKGKKAKIPLETLTNQKGRRA